HAEHHTGPAAAGQRAIGRDGSFLGAGRKDGGGTASSLTSTPGRIRTCIGPLRRRVHFRYATGARRAPWGQAFQLAGPRRLESRRPQRRRRADVRLSQSTPAGAPDKAGRPVTSDTVCAVG